MCRFTIILMLVTGVCFALMSPVVHSTPIGESSNIASGALPPLSAEDMQRMIDERGDQHFCALKSAASLKQKQSPDIVFYPTSNMYDYDLLYYRIDINIDFDTEHIDGYVDIRISSLIDGLSFVDLTLNTGLNVSSIVIDAVSQPFSHSTEILTVNFGETFNTGEEFTLRVNYNGYPPFDGDGMFFDYYGGRKICQTTCEPFGSRNWWPCKDFPFDKPDSIDIVITHPEIYNGDVIDCISAGTLLSTTSNGDGTVTTHWFEKYPIAEYLVALVVTDFDKNVQSWEYEPGQFMLVEHYYFPSLPPTDMSGSSYYMINYTLPALDAYTYYWGRYPFYDEKYGNMHCTFPGMEHQTMSSIGTYWSDEYVIIHELAHQWAGDQVTCKTFNHIWLNEGIGTYFEVMFYEYHYGWEMAHQLLIAYRRLNAGSPYVEDIVNDDIFSSTTSYAKGAWVTHMLRRQMGDSLFFPAMQYFFHESEFAGKSATTEDLNSVVSQYYGSDMSWFFDAWVYQPGQPDYEYSYQYSEDMVEGGYQVDFFLEYDATDGIFPMNVEIAISGAAFDTLITVWNGSAGDYYSFNIPVPPDDIQIDPNDNILKTVNQVPFAFHIASTVLPDAILGEPYSFTLSAVGGVPGYTWEKILGQFPMGMTLDPNTGVLSGIPTWPAVHAFKIRCTDSDDPPNLDERFCILTVLEFAYLCGDCDMSGAVDIDDVVFLINFIFGGGPVPEPIESGDADCSENIDIDDVVYLITYIFGGGPEPCATC